MPEPLNQLARFRNDRAELTIAITQPASVTRVTVEFFTPHPMIVERFIEDIRDLMLRYRMESA